MSAPVVEVDGLVKSDGTAASQGYSGGGSGGAVFIKTQQLRGQGK